LRAIVLRQRWAGCHDTPGTGSSCPRASAAILTVVVTATFDGYLDMTILTMRMVFPSAADLAFVVEKYHADEGGTQTLERLNEFLKARHD